MKKILVLVVLVLLCLPASASAVSNSVSICTFLEQVGYGTAFDLNCNPLWVTNVIFYVRSAEPDDPGTNRVTLWQSNGSGVGAAGDICYKKNSGGTVTSGLVALVESPTLLTVTQTWYSSSGSVTNVQIIMNGSLTSWTTNGVALP